MRRNTLGITFVCLVLLPFWVAGQSPVKVENESANGLQPSGGHFGNQAPPADFDPSTLKKPGDAPMPKGYLPTGMYNSLEEALLQPELVTSLDLKYKKLSEFPLELKQFKNLQNLDLSHNEISEIPDWISELPNLSLLALNVNRIARVPSAIGALTNLRTLYLDGNKIISIDPAIGLLHLLTDLTVSGSGEPSSFQPAIGQLKNLQVLRLWDFGFTEAPAQLKSLGNLQTLCLAHNKLADFPSFALEWEHLNYLNLGDNRLSQVPAEIGKLTELTYLGIYDNPVHQFPVASLKTMTSLNWLAAWGTQIPSSTQTEMSKSKTNLQVAFTSEDNH